jgi:hypothetical protein
VCLARASQRPPAPGSAAPHCTSAELAVLAPLMALALLCTLCSPADGGLRQLQVEVQKGGESLQHHPVGTATGQGSMNMGWLGGTGW